MIKHWLSIGRTWAAAAASGFAASGLAAMCLAVGLTTSSGAEAGALNMTGMVVANPHLDVAATNGPKRPASADDEVGAEAWAEAEIAGSVWRSADLDSQLFAGIDRYVDETPRRVADIHLNSAGVAYTPDDAQPTLNASPLGSPSRLMARAKEALLVLVVILFGLGVWWIVYRDHYRRRLRQKRIDRARRAAERDWARA